MDLKSPREYIQRILCARGSHSTVAYDVASELMYQATIGPATKLKEREKEQGKCLCVDCTLGQHHDEFNEVLENMKVIAELYHKISTNTLLAKFRLSSLLRAMVLSETPKFYAQLQKAGFEWPPSSEKNMPAGRYMRDLSKHRGCVSSEFKAVVAEKSNVVQ